MITRTLDLRKPYRVKLSEEGHNKIGPRFPTRAETVGMRAGLVLVRDRKSGLIEEYHPDFLELA